MNKILTGALLLLFSSSAAAQTPRDSIAFATAQWRTADLGGGAECRYAQIDMFGSRQSISVATYPGRRFTTSIVHLDRRAESTSDLGKAAGHIDFIRPAFPYDGVCGAFRRAAAKYGFIERYQRGKEDVTGIAREPWHFRYVGTPHALLMDANGLCLEEYPDFLRQRQRSCPLPGGQLAQVFYVPCAGEETEVQLPEGCCQISGDNIGGFIVTAWGHPA